MKAIQHNNTDCGYVQYSITVEEFINVLSKMEDKTKKIAFGWEDGFSVPIEKGNVLVEEVGDTYVFYVDDHNNAYIEK